MRKRIVSRGFLALVAVALPGTTVSLSTPAAAASNPVDLAALAASDGFRMDGEAVNHRTGFSVCRAGDVNGDGFDDVIVGARTFSGEPGHAYVVFGKSGGLPASLELSSLATGDGSSGFKLTGAALDDSAGFSVAGGGDVNGDGFDDVIVGAPGFDAAVVGKFQAGAAYVVFGRQSFAGSPSIALASLDGSSGFAIVGANEGDSVGDAVAIAGDVNHDGFADVVVGATGLEGAGFSRGGAYVVFGAQSFAATPALGVSSLDGLKGFALLGESNDDQIGSAVAGAGDVNGDSFDDVVVGGFLADAAGTDSGAAYVVFGKSSGFAASMALSGSMGAAGFRLTAAAGRRAGAGVAGVDLNDDGFSDVIVSEDTQQDGRVNVVFGKMTGLADVELASLDGTGGFVFLPASENDGFGESVGFAGDVNGDGADDLIVGAPFAGPPGFDRGAAYVLFGGKGAFAATLPSADLDGTNGFRIDGAGAGDTAGTSVACAGDVDGDGVDDVILGAPSAEPHGNWSGSAFVVRGNADGGGGNIPVTIARNGRKATFTDSDGDLVTVSTNRGVFTQANFTVAAAGGAGRGQLQRLRLAGTTAFAGAVISVKAKRAASGDGLADVGAIDAAGLDLAGVTVKGDLGRIVAGDPVSPKPALKKLVVQSLGARGLATQSASQSASLATVLEGAVKSITVKTDITKASVTVTGSLGKLSVGRDVVGGDTENAGLVDVAGGIKSAKVKGSLRGGAGDYSGSIFADGALGSASIGGSLVGGDGLESGVLESGTGSGKVSIRGDVTGGNGDSSGSVVSLGRMKSLRVKGDVRGGAGEWSGSVFVPGALGAIQALRIDGSLAGGTHPSTGIAAGTTIGKLTVGGDVTGSAATPVRILAGGVAVPASAKAAVTIGAVKVGGNVAFARILAGVDLAAAPYTADVQIGKVTVGGDWTASTLAAGVDAGAGGFGDADDRPIALGGVPAIPSRIASVTVKGSIGGTAAGGDHFGFVAEEIGAFKVGSRKLPFTKGARNDDTSASDPEFLLGADADVRAREVSP